MKAPMMHFRPTKRVTPRESWNNGIPCSAWHPNRHGRVAAGHPDSPTRRLLIVPRGTSHPASQAGFTLLEVILALAILAGALASLGEVVRLSGENANMARDLSSAQLLAASKLAAITSGSEELSTVERASLEIENADPPWLYSVQWNPTDLEDLILVQVTVEQDLPEDLRPVRFSLVRWMPDPGTVSMEDQSGTSASSTSSTSSSSGSSGSSGSSSGTGGR
ncbi:MAG: prepilin-type N-terminal cleavage/methylation domain-containing protein [Pirellulales bacterium]|nr:prepilin-type N-terminal cleavage/methylation domain-containing protein [Pirellulales bacterium]